MRATLLRRLRNAIGLVAINVAILGLLAGTAEVYLRVTRPYGPCVRTYPGQFQNREPLPWASPDLELGWLSSRSRDDINAQGFRDRKDFASVDLLPGRTRIMMLGDSFVWGVGVSRDQTMATLLEQTLPGTDVFNLSAAGWSLDQMYLAYLEYRDTLRPRVVVLAFIDDDVPRVLEAYRVQEGMNKPSFRVVDGALVRRSPADRPSGLAAIAERSAALRCLLREVARVTTARTITARILRRLAEDTARRGERLVAVRIPHNIALTSVLGRLGWQLRGFRSALEGTGATYLEPLACFAATPGGADALYLPDAHLTPTGQATLANCVRHAVIDAMNSRMPGE